MPQGPAYLQERWGDDGNALTFLAKRGLKPTRGGVFILPRDRDLTPDEHSALDYLWLEWDYATEMGQ